MGKVPLESWCCLTWAWVKSQIVPDGTIGFDPQPHGRLKWLSTMLVANGCLQMLVEHGGLEWLPKVVV